MSDLYNLLIFIVVAGIVFAAYQKRKTDRGETTGFHDPLTQALLDAADPNAAPEDLQYTVLEYNPSPASPGRNQTVRHASFDQNGDPTRDVPTTGSMVLLDPTTLQPEEESEEDPYYQTEQYLRGERDFQEQGLIVAIIEACAGHPNINAVRDAIVNHPSIRTSMDQRDYATARQNARQLARYLTGQ